MPVTRGACLDPYRTIWFDENESALFEKTKTPRPLLRGRTVPVRYKLGVFAATSEQARCTHGVPLFLYEKDEVGSAVAVFTGAQVSGRPAWAAEGCASTPNHWALHLLSACGSRRHGNPVERPVRCSTSPA